MSSEPSSALSRVTLMRVAVRQMQKRFLAEGYERTAPMRHALAALDSSAVVEWPLVHATAHKLAGLGGSIDLPEVTHSARALADLVVGWPTGAPLTDDVRDHVRACLEAVVLVATARDDTSLSVTQSMSMSQGPRTTQSMSLSKGPTTTQNLSLNSTQSMSQAQGQGLSQGPSERPSQSLPQGTNENRR